MQFKFVCKVLELHITGHHAQACQEWSISAWDLTSSLNRGRVFLLPLLMKCLWNCFTCPVLWNEFLYNIKSLKDFLHLGSDLGLVGDFVWHAKRADLTGFLSPLDTEAATWIQQLSSMQNLHPSGLLCGTTFDGLRWTSSLSFSRK